MHHRLGRVDFRRPVEWDHPLNAGLSHWWLALPGWPAGRRWPPLAPDIGYYDGTLNACDFAPSARPGGLAQVNFQSGATNYVDFGDIDFFDLGANLFTISLWVKEPTGVGWSYLLTKTNGLGADNGFELGSHPGGANTYSYYNGSAYTSFGTITGGWQMVTVVRTGSGAGETHLYVDGVLQASVTEPRTFGNAQSARLGYSNFDEPSYAAKGPADDLRLYSARPLSAAEVWQLYDLSRRGYPGVLRRRRRARFVPAAEAPSGDFPLPSRRPHPPVYWTDHYDTG
jgi:hypothetical protein